MITVGKVPGWAVPRHPQLRQQRQTYCSWLSEKIRALVVSHSAPRVQPGPLERDLSAPVKKARRAAGLRYGIVVGAKPSLGGGRRPVIEKSENFRMVGAVKTPRAAILELDIHNRRVRA
jgi:hypothetical protein